MTAWSVRRLRVADVLTLGNALCGTLAILGVTGLAGGGPERFRLLALLFLAGTLLDVLDGAAARRWGGSALGRPLDCLADDLTFGVAPPVVLAAFALPGASPVARAVVVLGALVYAAAALVRLADFTTRPAGSAEFVGLPTTSACVAAVYLGFLSRDPVVVATGLIVLAGMMVSPLPYPGAARARALSLAGWLAGLLGIAGLVDVRLSALLTLPVLLVVLPATTYLRARERTESAAT